jgi:hypothetical protein
MVSLDPQGDGCSSPQKNHRIRGAYLLDSVTEGIGHLWLQLLSARQMVPFSLPWRSC